MNTLLPLPHSILLAGCIFACTTTVHADIYKQVDADGHVTYSNVARPGAKRIVIDSASAPSSKGEAGIKPRSRTTAITPSDFPRVDKSTQRKRDDVRRNLLLEELASEQKLLDGARASARGKAANEQSKWQETLRLHEKNIEMLNKELANIR